MKKHFWIVSALCIIACLFTACGTPAPEASVVSAAPSPEAFGSAVTSVVYEEAEITEDSGSALVSESESTDVSVSEMPAVQPKDLTDYARFTVAYCDQVEQLNYGAEDPLYFWRAVGYLAGSVADDMALPTEGEFVTLTKADVSLLAHALFSDFSGEIPAITEEDPLISRGENNTYRIHIFDVSHFSIESTLSQDDSKCTVTTEDSATGETRTFAFSLTPYTGDSTGALWFPQSIAGISEVR